MNRAHRRGEGRRDGLAPGRISAKPPIGLRAGDAVCGEPDLELKSDECFGGRGGELTVDRRLRETERHEFKLQRRDIPADGADADLTLPEQRPTERTQSHTGGRSKATARR